MGAGSSAVTAGAPAAPKKKRIFVSYGHDAFEELAVRLVDDLERAYYNHYVIMSAGARSEREEGARALRKAVALVKARTGRIGDEEVVARFRESVPLVKAILAAAGAGRRRPVSQAQTEARVGRAGVGSRSRARGRAKRKAGTVRGRGRRK